MEKTYKLDCLQRLTNEIQFTYSEPYTKLHRYSDILICW